MLPAIFNWIFGRPHAGDDDDQDAELIHCARTKNTGKIWALLHKGADVNAIDKATGFTALHYAVIFNNIDLVSLLLIQSDLRILPLSPLNTPQTTPLHHAIMYSRLELAKLIYEYEPCLLDMKNATGKTCLHLACTGAVLPSMLNWLLALGANRDVLDDRYWTPLMWAVTSRRNERAIQLIEDGADVNEPSEHLSINSPLSLAMQYQDTTLVKLLIDRGARVEFTVPIVLARFFHGKAIAWDSSKAFCDNLASAALHNITLSNERSLEIARMVLLASSSSPSAESVFEFYGRYFVKSGRGQRVSVQSEIELGLYNNIGSEVHDRLLELLCLAVAGCTESVPDKEGLRERFQWEDGVFDRLVRVYEDISLRRISAAAARRHLLTMGYTNVTEGLRCEHPHQFYQQLICMDWSDYKYSSRLQHPSG